MECQGQRYIDILFAYALLYANYFKSIHELFQEGGEGESGSWKIDHPFSAWGALRRRAKTTEVGQLSWKPGLLRNAFKRPLWCKDRNIFSCLSWSTKWGEEESRLSRLETLRPEVLEELGSSGGGAWRSGFPRHVVFCGGGNPLHCSSAQMILW